MNPGKINYKNETYFPDGHYSFENPTSYAMKKVVDGKVTYNDGTLVKVTDHIKKNHYEQVYFKFKP